MIRHVHVHVTHGAITFIKFHIIILFWLIEFTTTSSTSRGQPRPSFDDIDTVSSTMTREVPSTVTTPTTATPSSSVIIPVMSSVTTPPTRELSSDYDDRLILNPNHESTRISLSEYEIESPGGRYYDEDGSHDNTLAQVQCVHVHVHTCTRSCTYMYMYQNIKRAIIVTRKINLHVHLYMYMYVYKCESTFI